MTSQPEFSVNDIPGEPNAPETQPQPAIKMQPFHIQEGMNIAVVISDGAGGGLLHPMMFKVKMVRKDGKIILRPAYKKEK